MEKVALILGIRGTGGQRVRGTWRKEVLPDVRGNCENCKTEIRAIPDWDEELGYRWPEACPNCGATLYLPGAEPNAEASGA